MSIIALSGLAPEWFTPTQPDSENQTRFEVKPLNGLDYLEVQSKSENGRITGKGIKLALSLGLIGWENFNKPGGEAVEFNQESLKLIPAETIQDLVTKILDLSRFTESERKN